MVWSEMVWFEMGRRVSALVGKTFQGRGEWWFYSYFSKERVKMSFNKISGGLRADVACGESRRAPVIRIIRVMRGVRGLLTRSGIVAGALFAGLTSSALGVDADTNLKYEVSYDGVIWAAQAAAMPGERLLVRASATYVANDATALPTGFAFLTFQPTISNVSNTDEVAPFSNRGNNTNGGSVQLDATPIDGPFGRVSPFAATGPNSTQFYRAHYHTNGSGGAPAGSYLRIARNDISNWMGNGVTNGTAAVNNFNGTGGLALVQKARQFVNPATDPAFRSGFQSIVLFQFALTLGDTSRPGNVMIISTPLSGFGQTQSDGLRRASWFASDVDTSGSLKTSLSVTDARITFVPAPGGVAGFAVILAGWATRRKR